MLSFIAVGLIMLLLAAPYIGVATVFMMAVEMMVMALFMVMVMMNPAVLNPMWMVHQHRLAAVSGFAVRSEERRVGQECGSSCRSRGSETHYKKKQKKKSR